MPKTFRVEEKEDGSWFMVGMACFSMDQFSPILQKNIRDACSEATPKDDAGLVEAVQTAIDKLSIDLDQRLTLERTMEIREGLIVALASLQGKEGGGS